jgi:hypothetical protein
MMIDPDLSCIFGEYSVYAATLDASLGLNNPMITQPENRGIMIPLMLCAELFLMGPPEHRANIYERVGMNLLEQHNHKLPKVQ